MSSMTEVVQTVKTRRADAPEPEPPKASDADKMAAASSPLVAPATPTGGGYKSPLWDLKKEESRMSGRKSGRASLMGSVTVREILHHLFDHCRTQQLRRLICFGVFLAGSRWGRGARWGTGRRRRRRRRRR